MFTKTVAIFDRFATIPYLVGFLLLFILTITVFFPFFDRLILSSPDVSTQELPKVDTQFFYTPQRLFEIFELYGEQGRNTYAISHLTADLIFPIAYTLLFGSWITFSFARIFSAKSWWLKMSLVPVGLFVLDLIENSLLAILLFAYPVQIIWIAWFAGVVTAIKWMFSVSTVFLSILGVVGLVYYAASGKSAPADNKKSRKRHKKRVDDSG